MKRCIPFIFIAAILFVQCRSGKMALQNDGWQNKEEYAVSGKRGLFKKQRMSFGNYHTTDITRSWVSNAGSSHFGLATGVVTSYDYTNIISLDYIKKRQTVRFSLADADNNISEVYCVSKFSAKDLTIGNRPNSIVNVAIDILTASADHPQSSYYVQLYTKQNEHPWELLLDNFETQKHPKTYTGYLSLNKDQYYTIHPVYQMEGKDGKPANILFGSIGFQFRNKEGKPVAAVSLLDKGVIYLQPLPAEEKFVLANACAALLLQDMIE